jgi:hypothetical protein
MNDTNGVELAPSEELKVTPEAIDTLRQEDWYKNFIGELKAKITETEFNIREDYIKLWHGVGKDLSEQTDNFNRSKVYGNAVIKTVAIDMEKSAVAIYKATQFYKMYPDLQGFLEDQGKNISWSFITKKLLPAEKLEGEEGTGEKKEDAPTVDTTRPIPQVEMIWEEKLDLWQVHITKGDLDMIDVVGLKTLCENYLQKQE